MEFDCFKILQIISSVLIGYIFVIVFLKPLRHKPFYRAKMAVCSVFIILALLCLGIYGMQLTILAILFYQLVILVTMFCGIDLEWMAKLYLTFAISLVQPILWLSWEIIDGIWLQPMFHNKWLWFLYVPFGSAVIYATHYHYGIPMSKEERYHVGKHEFLFAMLLFVIQNYNMYLVLRDFKEISTKLEGVLALTTGIFCLMIFNTQNLHYRKKQLQQELSIMNALWQQSKDHYELSRDNIEIMNQKSHDLKHHLMALRHMDNSKERLEYLDKMEEAIQIYESITKTGSEALDTILTEKRLRCSERKINIQCVADGSKMDFINQIDLYSVLGNILDNAMEEVEKFSDVDKRVVDVAIYVRQQFLIINVSNPLYAPIVFDDQLPVTTKGSSAWHGIGLRSVRQIIEKYQGFLSLNTENETFTIKIVIPLPE